MYCIKCGIEKVASQLVKPKEQYKYFYTETLNGYKLKFIVPKDKYSIDDIIYMLNEFKVDDNYKIISRTNWSKLWEDKVDYFEYQMGHLIKKYPDVVKKIPKIGTKTI